MSDATVDRDELEDDVIGTIADYDDGTNDDDDDDDDEELPTATDKEPNDEL